MAAVPELLLAILDDLGKAEMDKFKWYLRQGVEGFPQRIPVSQLENSDRVDTISKMVGTYQPEDAVKITLEILRKMNQNQLAETLKNKYGPVGALGEGFNMEVSSSERSTGHFQPVPALPPASNILPGTGRKPAAVASDEESVGKITYYTNNHLGKGADGIVFRGYFHCDDVNKRPAAVKRIELAKESYADREVALLLQLDDNPHVVRYFCTEDRQFLYIAIELCAVSLDKCFTEENPFDLRGLNPVMLLQQTMIGLEHLHSHNIVHRDVKPHNILLKDHSDSVTVKISDFGISKQLVDGRQSYSMRSGALGTMGWNAPEVLDDSRRVNPTSAVDIFSAGCVFYYVLTGGEHPFGKPNRRAGNIEDGKYNLDGLKKDKHEDIVTTDLIEQMLNMEPQRRPSAESVLKHPFFWSLEKQLMFFQDVSDSIVNETSDGPIIQQLESGGQEVVRNNWMEQITAVLQKDLEIRKGAYEEDSVKSLLRAIRNKKHHYHDSPKEVQKTLGSIPDDFVPYFTSRFPHLLLHTFLAMRSFAEELTLQHYYLKSNTKLRRQKRTHPA